MKKDNSPTDLPIADAMQAERPSRRHFLAAAALAGTSLATTGCASIGLGGGVNPGEIKQGSFVTSDGVKINYLESGRGRPVVMIPGWSQTAAMFQDQITAFSENYRVIAVDMAGDGFA